MNIQFPEKLAFLFQPAMNKVAYGGRNGTKSWGFAAALSLLGVGDVPHYQRPLRILCARETQTSIKQSVHQLLEDTIGRLGIGASYNVLDMEIRGVNGTEISFAGLKHNINNIKSLEGADIVWVEEAQTVSKASWDKLIPTIRAGKSELWVSFNPELATDDTYKRWVLAPPPGTIVVKTGWEDNRWLSERSLVEIAHMREKDPEGFDHIYGGECAKQLRGAIFGGEYKQALADGRIGSVPLNRSKPVTTIWDLGFGDPTAIWFVQAYDGYWNFIDYLESTDETTADYVIKLQNRGYMYDVDWVPHDSIDTIIHGRLNGTGDRTKSIEMLLREARRNVRIVPKLLITDQINAARLFWNQCRFDQQKCADGLQALAHYQWATSEAKPEFLDPRPGRDDDKVRKGKEPLHNWASHASSAFMGASIAVKQPQLDLPSPARRQLPQGDHVWMG